MPSTPVGSNHRKTKAGPRPRRPAEELAKLVSYLSNQEKAEVMFDLVYFAAQAAAEDDCEALNAYLAELEDLAEVYGDPQRREELQRVVRESALAAG
jgi:hypothetical protein